MENGHTKLDFALVKGGVTPLEINFNGLAFSILLF